MTGSDLVDAAWLRQRLSAPGLRVFDATKYLPGESKDGAALFGHGHIPGARFFDIDAFADPQSTLPHMAPTAAQFARLMGEAGVSQDDTVVFYDQKGQASAARGWWLLRLFGHAGQAALLDGGLPAWRAAGGEIETGQPAAPVPATYAARYHARHLRGLGDMVANLESRAELVLDARPAGRFSGEAPEPRPGLPSGHIPDSRSLPASELLDTDGRFRPAAEMRARFAAAGVDGSRPVVTSCGTGVTAAILAFGLQLAGLPEAAVYDGSWTEWASDPSLPRNKGHA